MNKPKYKTPTRPLYISVISWLALVPLALLVAICVATNALNDICNTAFGRLSTWVLALREVRV